MTVHNPVTCLVFPDMTSLSGHGGPGRENPFYGSVDVLGLMNFHRKGQRSEDPRGQSGQLDSVVERKDPTLH